MISPDSFRIAAFVYYITKNDFPEWLFAKKDICLRKKQLFSSGWWDGSGNRRERGL